MRIRKIELKSFKRFTNLVVEDIPETTKLVILVGPNSSGKTSLLEAMNHYYKYFGYSDVGDYHYLSKKGSLEEHKNNDDWYSVAPNMVNITFFDDSIYENMEHGGIKGHFYFRSAYRNEPDFQIDSMHRQDDPTITVRLSTLIQNDKTVSNNYQRLIANTVSGIFNEENNNKPVEELRDELMGKIRNAMSRVFEDLTLTSLGDPLNNGSFFFTKGTTKDFHYKNLSAGEKAAFDLILDMVVQSKYYPDAIYCIDEPETHMHTKLQGKVLRELYNLTPGNSQLWLSTHSIGMLQEAEDIEKEIPGTVAFLDFGGRDYDLEQKIRPSKIGKAIMDKFYELAFGDFAKLILPKTIVFCEGDSNGTTRKDFDKRIYTTIFSDTHPEAHFISGGSCNEIVDIEKKHGEIINTLLKNTNVIKVIDRDDRSEQEVEELSGKGIVVLSKRSLESYLLDNSVIGKLCDKLGRRDKYSECISQKEKAIKDSVSRGNQVDDIKSARGDIYNSLKRILGLNQCGNNADSFIRDTMAPLITSDMDVYRLLEREIFGK